MDEKKDEKQIETLTIDARGHSFGREPGELLSICRFNQYDEHEKITAQMSKVYKAKNADYGDSFHKSHVKHGSIAALVRMDDKLQRVQNLLLTNNLMNVKDETVEDTLLDLANYSVMLIVELRREKQERKND